VELPSWIFSLIEQLSNIEQHTARIIKIPRMSYIRYHAAPSLPQNFIAVGDAIMNLNRYMGKDAAKR